MDPVTTLIRRVQQAFADNTERSFTARQMYKYIGVKQDRDKAIVKKALADMEEQGLLKQIKEGKYRPTELFSESRKPTADIRKTPDGMPRTIRPLHNTDDLELDMPDTIIGTFLMTNHGGIVCGLSDKQIRDNVVVRREFTGGATDGDKVVVRLTRRGTARRLPEGQVVEVLGKAGDNDTEMHAILSEYGLPYSYPEELEQAADLIAADLTNEEFAQRTDMRDRLTFTIDPADAKDFDDALSLRVESRESNIPAELTDFRTDDNRLSAQSAENKSEIESQKTLYEIGVHIADVTHYVRPGTELDHEAYRRGTSVYLVDRTIPMLPEHISNELCSLRPDEDKLCFSVVFTIDANATVLSHRIVRTVIRSDRRLNYDEAQQVIDGNADGLNLSDDMQNAILTLNRLAKILRQKRMDAGALEFDREEMRFNIDEQGRPISVYTRRQTDANNLIEEFMLLANRTVAETMSRLIGESNVESEKSKVKEFVYRIHDLPDPDRLNSLSKFIRRFGYNLKTQSSRSQTITKNLNAVLRQAKGKTEENLIELLTVRTMAKAVYSTDNIGHYGLAFRHYTHFTSPIRRYPDMMVHRLLEQALLGAQRYNPAPYERELEYACRHCSEREQVATLAERASVRYKQAEFLQDKIGQEFAGHVSSVSEYGLHVQLDDNHCEGMVPIRFVFPNDYAMFLEDEYCIEGERSKKRYSLGDAVRVKVVSCDLDRKLIDFALV